MSEQAIRIIDKGRADRAAMATGRLRCLRARNGAVSAGTSAGIAAIRMSAVLVGMWVLSTLGAAGCTSDPTAPTDVLFLEVNEIEIGTGRQVRAGDRVVIDYVMWAYDAGQVENKGQEVDSRTGYAFFFGANQVIVAFDQGLVGMRVGGLRRLVIPYRHAVGGSASTPPGTPLVADVRLVDAQAVAQ